MRTRKALQTRNLRLAPKMWCIVRTKAFQQMLDHLQTDLPETRKALNRLFNNVLTGDREAILLDDREGIIYLKELVDGLLAAEEELHDNPVWEALKVA